MALTRASFPLTISTQSTCPRAPGALPTASPTTSLTQWSEATIRLFASPRDFSPFRNRDSLTRIASFLFP